MLIQGGQTQLHHLSLLLPILRNHHAVREIAPTSVRSGIRARRAGCGLCNAHRRRVRYEDDDGDGDGDGDKDEEYGHNSEIAMLESYSESVRSEALLVRATVDGEVEVVLIFKGFSSSLSARTPPDPSRSVLPAKAVVESIDVIKGPFDPTNIEYLEKGLSWESFKSRLQSNIL